MDPSSVGTPFPAIPGNCEGSPVIEGPSVYDDPLTRVGPLPRISGFPSPTVS